jgi:competence protein ComEC
MAKRKKKRSGSSPVAVIITLLIVALAYLFLAGCDYYNVDLGIDYDLKGLNIFNLIMPKDDLGDPLPVPEDGEAIYHFIDVGQGDAILVTTAEGNMLIDTSEQGARDELDAYLKAAGIKSLKYLVLTHPDADHIGNADFVINNYEVENVLMTDHAATSKTYERLLDAIENSKANLEIVEAGYKFSLGAIQNTVIAPNEDYNDPNEMSLVIKSVYGKTSVMLTGDAEVESEEDIVKKWSADALKCDILKVGHHGSTTSTTDAFLAAVDPDIAVISCGEGNKYGHPHKETMDKLTAKGIKIHRTDTEGSIIYKTDGEKFVLVESNK